MRYGSDNGDTLSSHIYIYRKLPYIIPYAYINLEVSNTPNGTKEFIPKPLRWVVERTFSWLDWFRRLSRNYEESTEVAEEMIDLAAIKILLNQI